MRAPGRGGRRDCKLQIENCKMRIGTRRTPSFKFAICNLQFAICIAFVAFLSSTTHAQEKWTLTTADFHSEPVILKGFDSSGVKVAAAPDADVKTIPADRFLDVSRPLPAAPAVGKYVLHLTGGDRLSGMPVTLK